MSIIAVTGAGGSEALEKASKGLSVLADALRKLPNDDAVQVTLSQNQFSNDVEKHISDYKKGRGYLSQSTAGELSARDNTVSSTLAFSDIKALKLYSGFSTGLSYASHARFVENLSSAAATSQRLEKLYSIDK